MSASSPNIRSLYGKGHSIGLNNTVGLLYVKAAYANTIRMPASALLVKK